jgi:hypothetical protein
VVANLDALPDNLSCPGSLSPPHVRTLPQRVSSARSRVSLDPICSTVSTAYGGGVGRAWSRRTALRESSRAHTPAHSASTADGDVRRERRRGVRSDDKTSDCVVRVMAAHVRRHRRSRVDFPKGLPGGRPPLRRGPGRGRSLAARLLTTQSGRLLGPPDACACRCPRRHRMGVSPAGHSDRRGAALSACLRPRGSRGSAMCLWHCVLGMAQVWSPHDRHA